MFSKSRIVFNLCRSFSPFIRPYKSTALLKNIETFKQCNNKYKKLFSGTLGLSIFTWLGLDRGENEDDELVLNIKRSILLIQRNELEKAEQLLHLALRLAQQMQNNLGITYVYDVMANLALERMQLDKAHKLFVSVWQRLLVTGISEDDLKIVHISLKLARISHLKTDYNAAQVGFEWSIEKLEKNWSKYDEEKAKKLLALAQDWYARLLIDNKRYDEGVDLLKKSLEIGYTLEEIDDQQIIVQLNDIATVYERMNNMPESLKYLKQASEMVDKIKNNEDMALVLINMARIYLKHDLVEKARKNCGYAWRLGKQYKNPEIEEEAKECLREAQQYAKSRT